MTEFGRIFSKSIASLSFNRQLINTFAWLFCLFFGSSLSVSAIDAQLRYAVFVQPDKGPYVETYININSRSIHFATNEKKLLQGAVEVTLSFERNDTIVLFDKYALRSPEIDTQSSIDFHFVDLQRFRLSEGTYMMHLRIQDMFDTSNHAEAATKVEVKIPTDKMFFSDILLASASTKAVEVGPLTKSGLNLVPRASAFYGTGQDTLRFYIELYEAMKSLEDSLFIVKASLSFGDKQIVANNSRFYRQTPKTVNAISDAFLLDDVPSGNYTLLIEARDRNNSLLASKSITIQRLNSKLAFDEQRMKALQTSLSFVEPMPEDRLRYYISAMRPISETFEREYADNMLKTEGLEVEMLKKYMYSFWERRNATAPDKAWWSYYEEVRKADELFSSKITRGHESERGRVFLQYGSPNSRTVVDNEPSAYPYEIWWYYEFKGQRNVRFVFYNPDMITNDYQLLHSEALGETYDPQWRLILYSRTTAFQNIDEQMNRGHFGSHLEDHFRNQ